jgi:hypothetical protein
MQELTTTVPAGTAAKRLSPRHFMENSTLPVARARHCLTPHVSGGNSRHDEQRHQQWPPEVSGPLSFCDRNVMPTPSTSESIYREIFKARVASAISMAKAVKEITHQGTLGEIREILIRELFRPLLPSDIGVSTGHLIDNAHNVSPQTDIVLFDRSLAPPMIFESLGLFPIESCLYVIEVKSKLTAATLRKSHESALAIKRSLVYSNQTGQFALTRSLLLAFSSDLAESSGAQYKSECQRYQHLYETDSDYLPVDEAGTPYSPPIRALCVVDREYGHERDGKWTGILSDKACSEVLVFIGGIINTYRCIAKTRRSIRMEDYIFPENTVFQPLSP